MKEIVLTPKQQPQEGLEAEVINPAIFAGKSMDEIRALQVFHGNRTAQLSDFFGISGSKVDKAEDLKIVIDGDVSRTKRIGEGMREGEILVKGAVDMYVGNRMRGGRITVEGNADSFAALEMRGGELNIKGNCRDYLGSAYRGNWRGMRGGSITVGGNAGSEIGAYMMGGRIHVKGNAGPFAGVHMKKGLIIIEGNVPGRVGPQMIGGNIVVKGSAGKILSGFFPEGEEKDVKIDGETFNGEYLKFSGDHAERNSKGVLYIGKKANQG